MSMVVPIIFLIWVFHEAETSCITTRGVEAGGGWRTLDGKPPLLLAHRGEKILVPEHTLPAYQLAAILGADYVEPDLCMTKDEHLVCHHDIFLEQSTSDVGEHPEFAHLGRNTSSGYKWYIKDFTLEELKTIKLKQKKAGVRPQDFNGVFSIPTFHEFLAIIHELNYKMNKSIGIAPELKTPSTFNAFHSPHYMEQKFLSILRQYGYPVTRNDTPNCRTPSNIPIPCPPVMIQSFEFETIQYLSNHTTIDLVMLVYDDPYLQTRQGIREVAKFAQYFSLWKESLFVGIETSFRHAKQYDDNVAQSNGGYTSPAELVQFVHENGLKFVVYTVYDSREPSYLLREDMTNGSKALEMRRYFELGVDGIFAENVAESRAMLMEAAFEMKMGRLAGSSVSASGTPLYAASSFVIGDTTETTLQTTE